MVATPYKVVDFAWQKPSVAELVSWGTVAVGCYVSHDFTKNTNAAYVKALAAVGIKTFLFFEDTATNALGGYPAGQRDASFAYGLAASYGLPPWATIVGTYDFDVKDYAPHSSDPMAKLGPVGEYAQAWHDFDSALNSGNGNIGDAAYGDYYLIRRLVQAGLCDLAVQTIAWSGGQVDLADITLFQNGAMLAGGTVDVEEVISSTLLTHLAWVPGEPDPTAPPQPQGPVSWTQWPSGVTLVYGMSGSQAVRVLQTACRNSGLVGVRGITVDGDFGPQTLTAVKNFQSHANIAVDGIAGPDTRRALIALNDL